MPDTARRALLLLFVCLPLLTGCGQKGPLYLPDEDSEEQPPR